MGQFVLSPTEREKEKKTKKKQNRRAIKEDDEKKRITAETLTLFLSQCAANTVGLYHHPIRPDKTRAVGGQRARLLGTFYIVTFLSLSHII